MSASVAVPKAETRLFLREPGSLFRVLAFPSLLLLGFGLIPGYREAEAATGPSTSPCRAWCSSP